MIDTPHCRRSEACLFMKLIDLIDKPQWSGTAPTGEPFVKQAEDTLIPDLISIVCVDGDYHF